MADSGKRATPRQVRSEQTLQAILDAADRVFAEQSVEAVSTTMIAKEAGLSVGALYRFFDDKTAIAVALTERYAVTLADMVLQVEVLLQEQGVDAMAEGMTMVIDGMADLCKDNPGYFAVMRHLRDNALREVQIDTLARWFEVSPRKLSLADRRRLAIFVSEVTRSLIERAPAKGAARRKHLDEITALLLPYVATHLGGAPRN